MNRRYCLKLLASTPMLMHAKKRVASDTSWTNAAPIPFAVQEIYPVAHQGELIIAGGIASRLGVPFFANECVAYCPNTNLWRTHSQLPEARHHAALVSTGERLFQLGGFHGAYTHVWKMQNTMYEFANSRWQPALALPSAQAEGVVTFGPDQHIHIVTGQNPRGEKNKKRSDHLETRDHWHWDLQAKKWEAAAPVPTARNSATGGWVGDQLIVAGGRTAAGNLDTVEIYDLKDDSWRHAKPMPLPQAGTAAVVVDDGLLVFGGEIFSPKSAVFENVWHYHLNKDQWSARPPIPTPRHGLGAVRFGDRVYVVGGATRPGGSGTSALNEVLILDEILSSPVSVPEH